MIENPCIIIIYTVDQAIDPHELQYLKTTRNDPLQGALTQARVHGRMQGHTQMWQLVRRQRRRRYWGASTQRAGSWGTDATCRGIDPAPRGRGS